MPSKYFKDSGTADPAKAVWGEPDTTVVPFQSRRSQTQPRPANPEKKTYVRPQEVTQVVWDLSEHWIKLGEQVLGVHPRANWENFSKRFQKALSAEPALEKVRAKKTQEYYQEVLTYMVDKFWSWIDSLPKDDSLRRPGPDLQMLFFVDNWPGLVEHAPMAVTTRRQMASLRLEEEFPDLSPTELLERFPGRYYGHVQTRSTHAYLDQIAWNTEIDRLHEEALVMNAEWNYFAARGERVDWNSIVELPDESDSWPADEQEEQARREETLRNREILATFVASRKQRSRA